MMTVDGNHFCDFGDCTAFAASELLIYGEDFYFCHHHAVELLLGDDALGALVAA